MKLHALIATLSLAFAGATHAAGVALGASRYGVASEVRAMAVDHDEHARGWARGRARGHGDDHRGCERHGRHDLQSGVL